MRDLFQPVLGFSSRFCLLSVRGVGSHINLAAGPLFIATIHYCTHIALTHAYVLTPTLVPLRPGVGNTSSPAGSRPPVVPVE